MEPSTMTSTKEQNIAVTQQSINEFLKGNIQGVLDLCTEEVNWTTYQNQDIPFGKTYKGKAAAGQFFRDLADSVDFIVFTPEKFYADEDMVFVITHQAAKVKATGKTFDNQLLITFKITDGKIAEFFGYIDSADMEKAFTNYNQKG
jgi:ketosteroid isomerase-like protein